MARRPSFENAPNFKPNPPSWAFGDERCRPDPSERGFERPVTYFGGFPKPHRRGRGPLIAAIALGATLWLLGWAIERDLRQW